MSVPTEKLLGLIREIIDNGVNLKTNTLLSVFLISLISAGIGAFLGAYLKKRGEEKALRDTFEDVKDRLRQTTSLTEEIRAAIDINTIEHQIRYSKLHDKRLDVIENLWHRLISMEQTGKAFIFSTGPTQFPSEEFQRANVAIGDFIEYSRLNKFWVGKDLFDEIEKVALRIDEIVHGSLFHCNVHPRDGVKFKEAMEKNKQAVKEITEEIPKAKEEIINNIRGMLDPSRA